MIRQCRFCDVRFDPDACAVPGARNLCEGCRVLIDRIGGREPRAAAADTDPVARAARIKKYTARAARKLPLFA